MADNSCIVAIDQGTTSSRAIAFDLQGNIVTTSQYEFTQYFPQSGWVEHDPEEIWETTLRAVKDVLGSPQLSGRPIIGIGITNQRETSVIWDRVTGKPIYNAIVWQDRRTAQACRDLEASGHLESVQAKTGLLLDPYFSATKVAWILDNVNGARAAADAGDLAFGTIDSFLIWRLTAGAVHATDATNASRTSLFNIEKNNWDNELLGLFNVPHSLLPEVRDCADDYGIAASEVLGTSIPILGVAGDQQAAAIGQCCFEEGSIKSTYGTGCFVLVNTGDNIVRSKSQLLTTVGYRINGKTTYALEGSIFVAGAAIQWLRDGVAIIDDVKQTGSSAAAAEPDDGVVMVPAFTGLGAPHWNPDARAALLGMTRGTGRNEIIKAALESVCYQTYDLLEAMRQDGVSIRQLKVDGGMVANNWMAQFLSDLLNLEVERPTVMETTALGVAYLVGLQAGIYASLEQVEENWRRDKSFLPSIIDRKKKLSRWRQAVECVNLFAQVTT